MFRRAGWLWGASLWCAVALLGLGGSGCARPVNPSFDVTVSAAREELGDLGRRSLELERPVLIAAGFLDPGFGVSSLTTQMRKLAADPAMVIEVPFFTTPNFDLARERMVGKLEALFPSDDPFETVEVDVIGISMGGLVARYSAMEDASARAAGVKRLRIRTLFTLGTPHHGAVRAERTLAFDARVADMRAGSAFLQLLDEAWADRDFELVAYTRLYDSIVGPANALDPDGNGWWLSPPALQMSHMTMHRDPRIIADILRRLRGEEPLARGDWVALPE